MPTVEESARAPWTPSTRSTRFAKLYDHAAQRPWSRRVLFVVGDFDEAVALKGMQKAVPKNWKADVPFRRVEASPSPAKSPKGEAPSD